MTAVHARQQVLQLGLGQQRARRRGVERGHRDRVVDDGQELVQHLVHADERGVVHAQVDLRLGQHRRTRRDEVARLRPRLHDAVVLEVTKGLQRGAHADAVLVAELAHRGQPVPRAQCTAGDATLDLAGQALIQRRVRIHRSILDRFRISVPAQIRRSATGTERCARGSVLAQFGKRWVCRDRPALPTLAAQYRSPSC